MKINISLLGKDKFIKQLERAGREAEKDVFAAVNKGGQLIRGEAVKSISRGARTGNVYRRGTGRTHTASAPGEFPKTDTGELVSNITVEKETRTSVTVGSRIQAPQGYWLETKEPSQGGREWLRPTVQKNADRVFKMIGKSVEKAIEKK